MQFSIEFYTNAKNAKPVEKFLRKIRERNKTLWAQTIKGLEKIKNRQYQREPLSKYIAENLWEIRIRSGTNILRIIYTFAKGKRIVLLHGFIKKSQKTPSSEIKIAQKYLRDFQKEKKQIWQKQILIDILKRKSENTQVSKKSLKKLIVLGILLSNLLP